MVKLTEKESQFLMEEFNIDPESVGQLSEDELLELSDKCFDIELEGDLSDGRKMPDRCGIASGLVDKLQELAESIEQ